MIKTLLTLKPLPNRSRGKRPKQCSICGDIATMEAYFDVGDGITVIERYCQTCSKDISTEDGSGGGPYNSM